MCVRRLEPRACVAYELLAADPTVVVVVPVVAAEALSCLRVRPLRWLCESQGLNLSMPVVAGACSSCRKRDRCDWRQNGECARRVSNE